MLIARDPQLSPSRPLACGSFRGSPTTPCWPRLVVRCGLAARSPWLCAFSAHLSWLLIVAWRRMGERGRSFGGGASFPGPCSPIVPLAALSRWLTVLPGRRLNAQAQADVHGRAPPARGGAHRAQTDREAPARGGGGGRGERQRRGAGRRRVGRRGRGGTATEAQAGTTRAQTVGCGGLRSHSLIEILAL